MSVSYDRSCATLQFASTVFSAGAGSGSVTVAAPPSCAWTASTAATWIHLSGGASGQGSGTVAFTVDANDSATRRTSYLTVARQSTPVVQTGGVLSILSVSPGVGAGSSGQFTFELLDQGGYGDISGLLATFTGAENCTVEATQSSGIVLLGDTGDWLGPIPWGSPGQALSNSVCAVTSGSSFTGSGSRLQTTFQMTFSAQFAGSHRITGEAWNSGGVDTGTVPLGTWTVPAVPAAGISPCDVNQDGNTDASDVQLAVNAALGASPPTFDLSKDGFVNVVDLQIVMAAVQGLGCSAVK